MAGYLEQNENRISGSFYWSFNPDSGDTGGLLLSWKGAGAGTPNRAKLALLDGLPATLTLTTAQRTPSLFTNLPAAPGAASAHALSAAYAESLQSMLEPPLAAASAVSDRRGCGWRRVYRRGGGWRRDR